MNKKAGNKVLSVFIKQGFNSFFLKKSAVGVFQLVRQCLHIVCCLSFTFCPFKQKMLSDLKLPGTSAVFLSHGSSSPFAASATFALTTVARSILPRNWHFLSSWPSASSKTTSLSQNSKLDELGQPWSCNPRWLPPLPKLCKSCVKAVHRTFNGHLGGFLRQ